MTIRLVVLRPDAMYEHLAFWKGYRRTAELAAAIGGSVVDVTVGAGEPLCYSAPLGLSMQMPMATAFKVILYFRSPP